MPEVDDLFATLITESFVPTKCFNCFNHSLTLFFPWFTLSPWICNHETDWWCHLWVFIMWDSIRKTVLGFFFFPQAFIINTPRLLLYQYILNSSSAPMSRQTIQELRSTAIWISDTAHLLQWVLCVLGLPSPTPSKFTDWHVLFLFFVFLSF